MDVVDGCSHYVGKTHVPMVIVWGEGSGEGRQGTFKNDHPNYKLWNLSFLSKFKILIKS
jgi:hypothetical protein